jgi:acetylornithine deacetylase/succinyl-diaminopimelate desuccinylase-like protein
MATELSRVADGAAPVPVHADDDARARALLSRSAVADALDFLEVDDPRTLADQRALTLVPAPPFAEAARGRVMAVKMEEAGLERPETDAEGNVVARYPAAPGTRDAAEGPLVVAAHLDTVFPPETPIEVTQDGDTLIGPGISDDGRGLAALLALARALRHGGLTFRHPLWFVATVGEEGPGDLRGVRHLFSADGRVGVRCRGFVSLDGAGVRRIVTTGLGSRRWRVEVRGPGGHSWVDHGVPNPIHALNRAVARFSRRDLPAGSTFSTGRQGGGTSVNAIPTSAWAEVELRSVDGDSLDRFADELHACVRDEVARVSDAGHGPRLETSFTPMGRRPAGRTAPDAALVRAAAAATRAVGVVPELGTSSTDANLPMSLGVPAITLGAGGDAGLAHTPREWYRNVQGPRGIARALLTLLLADGQG